MKKLIFSLIFISSANAITLQEAVNKALDNNKELLSYKQQIQTAKLQLKVDETLYLPTIYTQVSQSFYNQTPMTKIPNFPVSFKQSNREFLKFDVGFSQYLYTGGLTQSKIRASKYNLKATEALYKEKENQLKAEVIKAYIDVFISKSLIDIYKKELEAVESIYKQQEGFFQQGIITKVDLLQSKVRLSEVKRDLQQAEGNYKIALSRLSQLIGEDVKDENFEPVNIEVKDIPNLDTLTETAYQKRKILDFYKENINQAEKLIDIEKSAFLPKIFLQGDYIYTNQSPYLDPKGNFLLTIGASIEFQTTQPYYKMLQAKSNAKKLRFDLQDTKEKIKLELKTAYENYITAKENYKVALESLEYAKEYFELVKEQYANQLATNTDLLNAESSLTRALESKEINYYNLLKSYIDIKKAVGEDL
ncbi:TolC family protein [Sulfurihydrogenibium subterraneum]|uniref:TolC family protein n=1 Tax=Sulfurihydrogenibium subterraneum TaxID=171121 RepID=UPI0004901A45|nr:TolC family protein [Sulfurihydrogenibium subterraneum]